MAKANKKKITDNHSRKMHGRRLSLRLLAAILIVVAISAMGALWFIRSHADPYADTITGAPGGVYFLEADASYQAGQTFFLKMAANPPRGSGHLDLEVKLKSLSAQNVAQYKGYTCGSLGPCFAFTPRPSDSPYDFGVCIDVNEALYDKRGISVVNITYKKLTADPTYETAISALWYTGRCSGATGHGYGYPNTQPRLSDGIPDESPAQFGMGGGAQGSNLINEGPGQDGEGDDGEGPKGNGGGSGGSTSKKVANKPNPIPTAAAQGETTQQPKVEPSPFFDGKLYAAGSDAVDSTGVVSSALRKTTQNWPYVTGAVVILAVAGYLAWQHYGRDAATRFWRQRH